MFRQNYVGHVGVEHTGVAYDHDLDSLKVLRPPHGVTLSVATHVVLTVVRLAEVGGPSRGRQCLLGDADLVILMTMVMMSLAEVKSHLSELVGRVNGEHERITVTVHGKPSAVLIAPEDLESLEETLAILSDPDTLQRLAASDAELARGEGESEEQLAEAMNERRRHTA